MEKEAMQYKQTKSQQASLSIKLGYNTLIILQ